MEIKEAIDSFISSAEQPELLELVSKLLPTKSDGCYCLDDIDERLVQIRDINELIQHEHNFQFDQVLDENTITRFENLNKEIQKIQFDVMNLQCNIAYTKEQSEALESIGKIPIIRERREIVMQEENLKKNLQQIRFEPICEFYEKFSKHLRDVVTAKRRSCSSMTPNHLQLFDWTQFQHTLFLLRACGKALKDLNTFQKLYAQSDVEILRMAFKQPIAQTDFNNFIEFQDTYSVESQLEIITNLTGRQDFIDMMSDSRFEKLFKSKESVNYALFEPSHVQLRAITVDCCKLLLELNMNYIEAHLTEGINVDKLNGGENASLGPAEMDQTLPAYAFSPQEYITQIGQHLLTLRKQSEQFDNSDNGSLKFALEFLESAQDIPIDVKSYGSVAEIIMRCISRHCIRSLLGRTSNSILSKLTVNGRRQLATDALYLDNVLEDLKLLSSSEPNVTKFKNLLI